MTSTLKPRWGIVAVGILMFFVTLLTIELSGKKTSAYLGIWLLVAYYAYKGDLRSIKEWMKWLIFINLGILFFVTVFTDDSTIAYLANSQAELAQGVVIMLIPKIILYLHCNFQLEDILINGNNNSQNNTSTPKNLLIMFSI